MEGDLVGSGEFVGWMRVVFCRKAMGEVMGCSSKNVNRCKFTLLITKLMIKHSQSPTSKPILP